MTETTPTTHTFDSLLTFYEQGNVALRIALFIVVLWPLSALAAAMMLTGSKAQTIVPIVDMIPVAAILFVILGAPFGLIVLLRHPLARKGFLFLVGLIGIELAVGFYLSVVPVSSDRGLVPLLMLGTMALFFLSVAKLARFLRFLVTLALIIITIIFVDGGRMGFSSDLHSTFSSVNRQDFSRNNFPTFTLPLASDSWTQEITLPSAWTGFNLTVNRNFDDAAPPASWFGFRCAGSSGELIDSGGVYKAGQPYNQALFAICKGPVQFRGHANLLFERIDAATNASMTAAPSAPAQGVGTNPALSAGPAPKPFQPDWTKAIHIAGKQFIVVAAPCILRVTNLHCFIRITNQGNDTNTSIYGGGWARSWVVDEQGVDHAPIRLSLGADSDENKIGAMLLTDVPVLGSLTFDKYTGSRVVALQLILGYGINRTENITIRDIPVEREEP
jgi:hypothetical protein